LQLTDLADGQGNDQEDQPGQDDDDADEDDDDGEHAGHAGRVHANDRRLNEEGDRRPEHESAKEVAEEEEYDDRDDQGRDAERDLQVATATPGIERQGCDRDPADGGRTLDFSLAGRSLVGVGTHVMQSRAV